jgi:very-short-patch-repair endonuclease
MAGVFTTASLRVRKIDSHNMKTDALPSRSVTPLSPGGRGAGERGTITHSSLSREQTLQARAKRMRTESTAAESELWRHLRAKRFVAFKIRRQVPIGEYIVDFVCHAKQVVIEVDGSQHLDSQYDETRSEFLSWAGYLVVRFWNADVLTKIDGVLETIWFALHEGADVRSSLSPLAPLPPGERGTYGEASLR